MPKGSKKDRMVKHIVESEMKSGKSKKKAEEIAYGHMQNLNKKKK